MLEHGGQLHAAATRYAIPLENWLDLSTGINPNGWPVPHLSPSAWARLPEINDGLEQAAQAYYATPHLLPCAGSQAIIQALPKLRPTCRVGAPDIAYAEHAYAWQQAGHQILTLPYDNMGAMIEQLDVLIIINPNNPTGQCYSTEILLEWRLALNRKGGWLIVDEAFMDVTPNNSLMPYSPLPGLIILRSLGKFFGLAGARVGFAAAEMNPLHLLRDYLGPWTLTGPSREIAKQALIDKNWQQLTRIQLKQASMRLSHLLSQHGLEPDGGTALFQWVRTSEAEIIQETLARQGILVRLFKQPQSLRFGLPRKPEWDRLERALCTSMPLN
ncbi:threonine-phosphate decarboxylase [Candidatus Thiomargarita nelsonii]|uniref:threonine-phosphate decarboxylase n=1 Tax=Candidatus Thiomargarita nelsonii TaxID=1003181 RepID=A0A0A6PI05_9GAMM|nr:threonine-phosphate decarboxylase [Candidatus Thiomargarita nelsonii]